MFVIVWPERRSVSSTQIRSWYNDAVSNGEIEDEVLPDREEHVEAMAQELHDIGAITLGRRVG